MWINHFKVAIRGLIRHKTLSLINVVGLAIAMCICLLLAATGMRELSFDKFHQNASQLYALYFKVSEPDRLRLDRNIPMPLAPALRDQVAGVNRVCRVQSSGSSILYEDKLHPISVTFVDPDFLQMFSFPIVRGNASQALANVSSAVITEKVAKVLFGDDDPIGKVITEKSVDRDKTYVISAVAADMPYSSTVRFNVLVRFENAAGYGDVTWDNHNHQGYVLLDDAMDPATFSKRSKPIIDEHYAPLISQLKDEGVVAHEGDYVSLNLMPLTKMRFATELPGSNSIPKMFPVGLLAVGLMILLIASFNFINIVLGSSLTRTTEIGVRKVLGASRKRLIIQLFSETAFVILLSAILALSVVQLILPQYNSFFRFPITMSSPYIWFSLLAVLIIVAAVAGGYPAVIMSRHQGVQIIRQSFRRIRPRTLRNSLVVFQLCIASLLIGSAIMVTRQLDFLRDRPLGYNASQVISLPVRGGISGEKALALMRNTFAGNPSVQYISGSGGNLGLGTDGSSYTSVMGINQDGHNIRVHWFNTDYDIVETLDLQLTQGRTFDRNRSRDTTLEVVINQKLADEISPGTSPVGTFLNSFPPAEILGVVDNFHFQSLRQPVENQALVLDPNFPIRYVLFKVVPENMSQTMRQIKNAWAEIAPNADFQASLLDENVNRQYQQESIMMRIVTASAIIAVFLAAMGLFGISLLVVEQRTKEIGIRKVLGASVVSIVRLLGTEFTRLVVVALLIATPLAWYLMRLWLNSFAYRVEMSIWVFVLAGFITIVIALGTASIQSVKVGLANPANSLRDEQQ